MIRELQPTLVDDDGIFWMSWEDFLHYFKAINVCYLAAGRSRVITVGTWMKGLIRPGAVSIQVEINEATPFPGRKYAAGEALRYCPMM